jgi:hypothetical protein
MADISRYVDGLGVSWLSRVLMMVTFRTMLIKRRVTGSFHASSRGSPLGSGPAPSILCSMHLRSQA